MVRVVERKDQWGGHYRGVNRTQERERESSGASGQARASERVCASVHASSYGCWGMESMEGGQFRHTWGLQGWYGR